MIQIFLTNHPNSGTILNYAWHSATLSLKGIIIHSMADWYTKATSEGDSESQRLSRILDVSQDLKALSVLLNVKTMPFVIDLAVMASRREYLNLEKWLTDQLREHGEAFCKLIVQVLKRKFPPFMSASNGALTEEHFTKVNMAVETLASMLICMQSFAQHVPNVHPELKDALEAMIQISRPILSRPRPPMPPGSLRGAGPHPGLDAGNPAVGGTSAPPTSSGPVGFGGGPPGAGPSIPSSAAGGGGAIRPTPRQAGGGAFNTQSPHPNESMLNQFQGKWLYNQLLIAVSVLVWF